MLKDEKYHGQCLTNRDEFAYLYNARVQAGLDAGFTEKQAKGAALAGMERAFFEALVARGAEMRGLEGSVAGMSITINHAQVVALHISGGGKVGDCYDNPYDTETGRVFGAQDQSPAALAIDRILKKDQN